LSDQQLEQRLDTDELSHHGTFRTFLAPCLLVAASVLSLAGISVAAAHRTSAATPTCARMAASQTRTACR